MSVDWSETFTFRGNSSGGIDIISTNAKVNPKFPGPRFSGEPGKVILAKILAHLKDVAVNIDLDNLTADLQKTFNGCWTGSDDHVVKRVVFNHHGDLVLELERREPVLSGKTLWKNEMAHSNGFLQSKSHSVVYRGLLLTRIQQNSMKQSQSASQPMVARAPRLGHTSSAEYARPAGTNDHDEHRPRTGYNSDGVMDWRERASGPTVSSEKFLPALCCLLPIFTVLALDFIFILSLNPFVEVKNRFWF